MATCRKYGVRSWPQVKLFKYGKYEGEYYGAEDACEFILFPRRKFQYQSECRPGQENNVPFTRKKRFLICNRWPSSER